jgi:hypothetical protein
MEHFAGLDVSVNETSICIVDDAGQDRSRNKGGKRTGRSAGGTEKHCLPLQAHWTGSRTAVSVALQRSC